MTITNKEINDDRAVNRMPSKWLQIILACIVLLGFVGVTAVHAHEGIEIGPYLVTIGWEIEPAIVGERNASDPLQLTTLDDFLAVDSPLFSPDGRYFAFISATGLYIMEPDGQNLNKVLETAVIGGALA